MVDPVADLVFGRTARFELVVAADVEDFREPAAFFDQPGLQEGDV